MDCISETLQDFDTRHDWRFEQTIAPDISIDGTTDGFDIPTSFKKPYVAYLNTSRQALWFIERANWHRVFPGDTTRSVPRFYTIYNNDSGGQGDLFPPSGVVDTMTLLYYRGIAYTGGNDETLDIPARWEGYILAGARALLVASKLANEKALFWERRYEAGIARARQDDLRLPDQFLSFQPPSAQVPAYGLDLRMYGRDDV
jgi:hypothetical protein